MDKSKIECSLCAENYNGDNREPYYLTCGHTICFLCLTELKRKYANKPGITCPFCRKDDLKYAKNFALIEEFGTLGTKSYIKKLKEDLSAKEKFAFIPNALYKLKAKHSNKYLGIRGGSKLKGVGLVPNEKSQQLHGVFNFIRQGDYYMILPQHTKLALQIPSDNIDFPLAPIIQDDFNGEDHQLWKLEEQEDGTYFIISKKSNMCFDVDLVKKENGTAVLQYCQKEGKDASNQLFYFEMVLS